MLKTNWRIVRMAASVVALLLAANRIALAVDRMVLGANFNEGVEAATGPILDAAQVVWIRGFLPAFEFVDGQRQLIDDEDVDAFAEAVRHGRRTVLTLKWDFVASRQSVPAIASSRERRLFAWAIDAARTVRPDVLCLVNETFIDTRQEDLKPTSSGSIPMLEFLKRLATEVRRAKLTSTHGAPVLLSSGGFTRLSDADMQKDPAVVELLKWLKDSPAIDAVNLHMHHRTIEEFQQSLDFIRLHVPDRPLIVTEFSRVWEYRRHLADPIAQSPAGVQFAQRRQLEPTTTVRQYLNAAYAHPVPEDDFNAFLNSQPWYSETFLRDACELMESRGVMLATYAYSQRASGGRGPIRRNGVPWGLNPVFLDTMTQSSPDSGAGRNERFFQDFVAWQQHSRDVDPVELVRSRQRPRNGAP